MKHIPNILTMLRVVLVPFFLWLIFFCDHPASMLWAAVVFIIASISDYFDGKIAREYQVVSNFGKIMDPLADKVLVISALIVLMIPPISYIHPIVFGIIVFRELAVTILRDYYARKKIYIPANIWGKLKTTFQLIGIIAALLYYSLRGFYPMKEGFDFAKLDNYFRQGFIWYFWFVALVTFLSGVNYFIIKGDRE